MQTRLAITQPSSLPLREGFGTVDAVACFRQMDRRDQPHILLGEIARVLRPGGLLLLSVPERRVWPHWAWYRFCLQRARVRGCSGPWAIVVIGGLLTSTALTLLVASALQGFF